MSSEILPQRVRIAILIALLAVVSGIGWRDLHGTYREVRGRITLNIEKVESPLLSNFSGRRALMQAAVVLPPASIDPRGRAVPIMYHFSGFGADLRETWKSADILREMMVKDPSLAMIHIYMDASIAGGYSYFTDSDNNGPWATAFATEFIPAIEGKLSAHFTLGKRYLTGHSSGGWTALWLQLQFPRLFSGVWATSPDPVDFSDFFGIDLRPGSSANFYTEAGGPERLTARVGALGHTTLRDYIASDEINPKMRGDIASYEWAFGSRSPGGGPLRLFDRKTGILDQQALKDWERFDIRKRLEGMLPAAKTEIDGKIHIVVGNDDDFFLERPTKLFCSYFETTGLTGTCMVVPQRGHRNLYFPHPTLFPAGLLQRILEEAASRAE